jgi:hypothetical protein
LAAAAGLLMGSTTARLYHDHMLTKEPGTRAPTPWHQDQPYYNVEGRQNVSFWIPADPVRRHSTLEFLAGSHRGPWLMPRTFMTHEARWFPEGSLAELPDIEADRSAYPLLGWALEPGDVVAFHMLTLHATAGVDADRRRRVFSVRFLGDDMRHAPRRWKTSPEFPGLADELPAGAPVWHHPDRQLQHRLSLETGPWICRRLGQGRARGSRPPLVPVSLAGAPQASWGVIGAEVAPSPSVGRPVFGVSGT